MARTGLRMPTFPSPSLKFRTAGFPRYGFKASLSGRAFPNLAEVKPAPGMPVSTPGLHRPFARFHPRTLWPGTVSRPGRASASRCAGGPWPPYPRGPWLRSEFCCLGADFGDRDQPDRSIVITKIGDRDRSAATLVGQVMSWGSPPFCATVPLAQSGGPGEGAGHRAHQPESDPRRNRATSAAGAGW